MATLTAPPKRRKKVPASFYWSEECHEKIKAHQRVMAYDLKRSVTFVEAVEHFVLKAVPPLVC